MKHAKKKLWETKLDLNWVFHKNSKIADVLSPYGSTCAYESFNRVVASKAPKKCIIIQNQRILIFILFKSLLKEHWLDLYDGCKYCN